MNAPGTFTFQPESISAAPGADFAQFVDGPRCSAALIRYHAIQECRQGGASVAGVALAHGLTGTGKDQLDKPREVEKCVLSA